MGGNGILLDSASLLCYATTLAGADSLRLRSEETRMKLLVLIPALNEEASIGTLVAEVRTCVEADVLVVDDGSKDETRQRAERAGAIVLSLPCNLGIGGAVQTGFRYALENGYDRVVRIDGDGQHPPGEIPVLIECMDRTKADLVVGSRFLGEVEYQNTALRSAGIRFLSLFLSAICRKKVTDPTSGFHLFNRLLIWYFSRSYPTEYPEPESLALIRRQGYSFEEVGVGFRNRVTGRSSLNSVSSLYFALKVTIALLTDRARGVDQRFARKKLEAAV